MHPVGESTASQDYRLRRSKPCGVKQEGRLLAFLPTDTSLFWSTVQAGNAALQEGCNIPRIMSVTEDAAREKISFIFCVDSVALQDD